MKLIYKNQKIRLLSIGLALLSIVSLGLFVQGCSQEDDMVNILDSLDPEIVNATELEDYVVAGADFSISLAKFTIELNKINFSKLEITCDAEGQEVIHLPATVGSIELEKKIQMYNEKKEVLFNKVPQFASLWTFYSICIFSEWRTRLLCKEH